MNECNTEKTSISYTSPSEILPPPHHPSILPQHIPLHPIQNNLIPTPITTRLPLPLLPAFLLRRRVLRRPLPLSTMALSLAMLLPLIPTLTLAVSLLLPR